MYQTELSTWELLLIYPFPLDNTPAKRSISSHDKPHHVSKFCTQPWVTKSERQLLHTHYSLCKKNYCLVWYTITPEHIDKNTPLHMVMKPRVLVENLQCAYSECYSKQNQNKVKGSYSSVTSMYAFMRSGAHTYNTADLIGCIHVRTGLHESLPRWLQWLAAAFPTCWCQVVMY